jgi:hypothetical protein
VEGNMAKRALTAAGAVLSEEHDTERKWTAAM